MPTLADRLIYNGQEWVAMQDYELALRHLTNVLIAFSEIHPRPEQYRDVNKASIWLGYQDEAWGKMRDEHKEQTREIDLDSKPKP